MKIVFLLALLVSTVFIGNAQSNLELVRKNGYHLTSVNYDYSMGAFGLSDTEKLNKKIESNSKYGQVITEEQFLACMKGDVFNYFPDLKQYNTPLKKKIYIADSAVTYDQLYDSILKLKVFHESNYECVEYTFHNLDPYNLKSNTFSFQSFLQIHNSNSYTNSQINKGRIYLTDFANMNKLFSSIAGFKQKIKKNSPYEYTLQTTIKISDERKALIAENAGYLSVTILFNRYDVSGNIYKPRKVILHVGNEVIQTMGDDSQIDELLNTPLLEPVDTLKDKLHENSVEAMDSIITEKSLPEGKNINNQNNKVGKEKETDSSAFSDKTVEKFNLKERRLLYFSQPENPTTETGVVRIKVQVNRPGIVIKAKPDYSGCSTTNSKLIELAKEAALRCRFNSNLDAPKAQTGTLSFYFELKEEAE